MKGLLVPVHAISFLHLHPFPTSQSGAIRLQRLQSHRQRLQSHSQRLQSHQQHLQSHQQRQHQCNQLRQLMGMPFVPYVLLMPSAHCSWCCSSRVYANTGQTSCRLLRTQMKARKHVNFLGVS